MDMTGTIAVIMVFAIPIIAIISDHFTKQTKYKQKMLEDQLKLEQMKHENFVLETEKMKLELQKMELNSPSSKKDQII